MNALYFMQSPYWSAAGWTMLHFLWIGSAVAALAALGRRALRRAAPQIRYAYTLVCFTLLAASPLVIAVWVAGDPPPQLDSEVLRSLEDDAQPPAWLMIKPFRSTERPQREPGSVWRLEDTARSAVPDTAGPYELGHRRPSAAAGVLRSAPDTYTWFDSGRMGQRGAMLTAAAVAFLPWLWIAGTPLTLAMLLAGFMGAERLRRQSSTLQQGELQALCARLSRSLAIARHVAVGVCDRVASPIVLGIVKPMILLPPAALAGWSPEQLEMVLLHELAHVRRWDNLVNLLQRLVESLLFFHPAIWVISAWIRAEREHCCDAVVVAHTGRPEAYAETLASLAGANITHWATATAMAERNLTARIRRLLNLEDRTMRVSFSKLGFVIGTCVAAVLIVMTYGQEPGGDEPGDEAPVSSAEETLVGEEPATADVTVAEEEPVFADVAVDEDPTFSDAVVNELSSFADEGQSSDAEVAELKKRVELYLSFWRATYAELTELKQLLAERGGEAVQTDRRTDDSSADTERHSRALRELTRLEQQTRGDSELRALEARITSLRKQASVLAAGLKDPGESKTYRAALKQLRQAVEAKKQLERDLRSLLPDRRYRSSQADGEERPRTLSLREQNRVELLARQRARDLISTARREEIQRLKTTLELMRRSYADESGASQAVRKAEEWLQNQIEKLQKELEASENGRDHGPSDDAVLSKDARRLNEDARRLIEEAETLRRRPDDASDSSARIADAERLQRLEDTAGKKEEELRQKNNDLESLLKLIGPGVENIASLQALKMTELQDLRHKQRVLNVELLQTNARAKRLRLDQTFVEETGLSKYELEAELRKDEEYLDLLSKAHELRDKISDLELAYKHPENKPSWQVAKGKLTDLQDRLERRRFQLEPMIRDAVNGADQIADELRVEEESKKSIEEQLKIIAGQIESVTLVLANIARTSPEIKAVRGKIEQIRRTPPAPTRHDANDDRGARLERLEREMNELKQMIRILQEAVMSRATSAVPRPASPTVPAQPIPGTWPARPPAATPRVGPAPQLDPTEPHRAPPGAPARADKRPMPPGAPRSAPPQPARPPAGPAEPQPSAVPEPAEPPKSSDEPAKPLDTPEGIEP